MKFKQNTDKGKLLQGAKQVQADDNSTGDDIRYFFNVYTFLFQGGAIVDDFWIVKEKHGPGLYNCRDNDFSERSTKYRDLLQI